VHNYIRPFHGLFMLFSIYAPCIGHVTSRLYLLSFSSFSPLRCCGLFRRACAGGGIYGFRNNLVHMKYCYILGQVKDECYNYLSYTLYLSLFEFRLVTFYTAKKSFAFSEIVGMYLRCFFLVSTKDIMRRRGVPMG